MPEGYDGERQVITVPTFASRELMHEWVAHVLKTQCIDVDDSTGYRSTFSFRGIDFSIDTRSAARWGTISDKNPLSIVGIRMYFNDENYTRIWRVAKVIKTELDEKKLRDRFIALQKLLVLAEARKKEKVHRETVREETNKAIKAACPGLTEGSSHLYTNEDLTYRITLDNLPIDQVIAIHKLLHGDKNEVQVDKLADTEHMAGTET